MQAFSFRKPPARGPTSARSQRLLASSVRFRGRGSLVRRGSCAVVGLLSPFRFLACSLGGASSFIRAGFGILTLVVALEFLASSALSFGHICFQLEQPNHSMQATSVWRLSFILRFSSAVPDVGVRLQVSADVLILRVRSGQMRDGCAPKSGSSASIDSQQLSRTWFCEPFGFAFYLP